MLIFGEFWQEEVGSRTRVSWRLEPCTYNQVSSCDGLVPLKPEGGLTRNPHRLQEAQGISMERAVAMLNQRDLELDEEIEDLEGMCSTLRDELETSVTLFLRHTHTSLAHVGRSPRALLSI